LPYAKITTTSELLYIGSHFGAITEYRNIGKLTEHISNMF